MSNENSRPMYFSQIRVDPTNDQNIYVAGLPTSRSTDGGRTFTALQGQGHVDQHAMWINPKDGRHLITGNDGGFDISYDQGETWESPRTTAQGMFYQVSVDMQRPYNVCGGLQDNGSWCGPSHVRGGQILGQDWFNVQGSDGFYTQIDPTDHTTIYSESQNGGIQRMNLRTGQSVSIRPNAGGGGRGGGGGGRGGGGAGAPPAPPAAPAAGPPQVAVVGNIVPPLPADQRQLRTNWNTALVLSPHDPNVVYTGTQRLHRSTDRGETWTASPDLTKAIDRNTLEIMGVRGSQPMVSKNDGTSFYSVINTIAESPAIPGLIWVGADDGSLQFSRDFGATWTNVSRNVPAAVQSHYVTRVEPSYFDPATTYVTFDGHRTDDLKPYVFVTRDYGQTWTSISSNLPASGCVNVIKQDPKNKDLLYVGTDFGFFVSTNEGREWKKFMNNLPVVRIDDVVIHPRDGDLVLATHGRSIWIMDDVTSLQQLTPQVQGQDAYLFDVRPGVRWASDRTNSRSVTGAKNFRGQNAPAGTAIQYFLRTDQAGPVRLTITNSDGLVLRTLNATQQQGINRVQWDLGGSPQGEAPQPAAGAAGGGRGAGGGGGGGGGGGRGGGGGGGLQPGTYYVNLTVGGRTMIKPVRLLEDLWFSGR